MDRPLTPDELAHAHDEWTRATARVVAKLPDLRGTGVLAHWSDETYELLANGGPLFVEAAFTALSGDLEDLQSVADLIAAHGRTRARTALPSAVTVRVAVLTRRELLDLTFAEVGDALPLELNVAVCQALGRLGDEVLIAHMSAYHEEASVVAAETDAAASLALEVADMAFAHGRIEGPVAYANEKFGSYFSRTDRSGPVGKAWEDVLPVTATELLQDVRRGEDCWRDLEAIDEYGIARLLRVSMHPVGQQLQVLAIDVGDRVAYERQHAEFVRGLIHDLRAPLTLITGWSNTLTSTADRIDEATRTMALETIHKAGKKLQDLTDNLLELVLIESGAQTFVREDVDIADIARGVGEILPDVEVDAPVDAVTALTDADAVSRVLVNLIENARAYGAAPMVLSVGSNGNGQTPSIGTATGSVRLTLADHGECDADVIRAALRGRVRSARGFGIGLRTSALIAWALGGSLELTCTRPTTFTLTLPSAG